MYQQLDLPSPPDVPPPLAKYAALPIRACRAAWRNISSGVGVSFSLKIDIGKRVPAGDNSAFTAHPAQLSNTQRDQERQEPGRAPLLGTALRKLTTALAPGSDSPAQRGWAQRRQAKDGRAQARQDRPAAISFWHALSPQQRQTFESMAQRRTFARGATLMYEGEEADHIIVIIEGWTKICVNDNGTERVIAERGPGQLVGERAAFQVSVRSASVIALQTVKALAMKTEDFAHFVSTHPGVLEIVEGQVYDRLTQGPTNCGQAHCSYQRAKDFTNGSAPMDPPHDGTQATTARRCPSLSGEHCTVVLTDVVAFGARYRKDEYRRIIRTAILEMTQTALSSVWGQCGWEDRGDGLLIVVPPSVATTEVITRLHQTLPAALRRHNRIYGASLRIQLRVAVNVGPVVSDAMGLSGEAIILGARLLDAPVLKQAIADRRATLGMIVSTFVYETSIRHAEDYVDPEAYREVQVTVKESSFSAWMQLVDPQHHGPR
jgi:Cyclic nucleotide-binding domain